MPAPPVSHRNISVGAGYRFIGAALSIAPIYEDHFPPSVLRIPTAVKASPVPVRPTSPSAVGKTPQGLPYRRLSHRLRQNAAAPTTSLQTAHHMPPHRGLNTGIRRRNTDPIPPAVGITEQNSPRPAFSSRPIRKIPPLGTNYLPVFENFGEFHENKMPDLLEMPILTNYLQNNFL